VCCEGGECLGVVGGGVCDGLLGYKRVFVDRGEEGCWGGWGVGGVWGMVCGGCRGGGYGGGCGCGGFWVFWFLLVPRS